MSAEAEGASEQAPAASAPPPRLGPAVGLWAGAGALAFGGVATYLAVGSVLSAAAPLTEGLLGVGLFGALGAGAGACARLAQDARERGRGRRAAALLLAPALLAPLLALQGIHASAALAAGSPHAGWKAVADLLARPRGLVEPGSLALGVGLATSAVLLVVTRVAPAALAARGVTLPDLPRRALASAVVLVVGGFLLLAAAVALATLFERRLGIRLDPPYGSRSLLTAPLFTLFAAALGTGAAGFTVGPASAVLFGLAERLEPRLPRRADEALL